MVSTQYKSVLDAIRANSKTFLFVDEERKRTAAAAAFALRRERRERKSGLSPAHFWEELRLIKTCGAFITMPGGPASKQSDASGERRAPISSAALSPVLSRLCSSVRFWKRARASHESFEMRVESCAVLDGCLRVLGRRSLSLSLALPRVLPWARWRRLMPQLDAAADCLTAPTHVFRAAGILVMLAALSCLKT